MSTQYKYDYLTEGVEQIIMNILVGGNGWTNNSTEKNNISTLHILISTTKKNLQTAIQDINININGDLCDLCDLEDIFYETKSDLYNILSQTISVVEALDEDSALEIHDILWDLYINTKKDLPDFVNDYEEKRRLEEIARIEDIRKRTCRKEKNGKYIFAKKACN
jgi:hypothetical protein